MPKTLPCSKCSNATVRAVVQQVAGNGVAQQMWAHLAGPQPGCLRELLELAREVLASQMTALAERWEQPFPLHIVAGFRHAGAIIRHRTLGGIVEWHQALLVALAAHDQHAGATRGG